jgi:hypothetical protein
MVISYIHSICWRMKSAFYECQHLLVGQLWGLGFELEEPLIEIGQWLSPFLHTGEEIFFSTELHLEPFEVEENLIF